MKAPFPWFGGKSRVSDLVWDRFGDVRNYVEPFAGSLAVLLARPHSAKIETVNDLDCWIANFWRALQADPDQVAHVADWPVNEADLHARHLWLVNRTEFRERMKTDPDYFDPIVAGRWVWGISQWIGSGWCAEPKWTGRTNAARGARGIHTPAVARARPMVSGTSEGQGVHRSVASKRPLLTGNGGGPCGVHRKLPDLGGAHGSSGRGTHQPTMNRQSPAGDPWQKRPRLDEGRGVSRQLPSLGGTSVGKGVNASLVSRQIPQLGGDAGAAGRSIHTSGFARDGGTSGLLVWMRNLSDRLRRVRVCCGEWDRILGPAPTTCIGTTAVFLDPPYAVEDRSDVYGEESRDVAHRVREWALLNGDNQQLRIALCGYEGEHAMPPSWTEIAWKTGGGFANQKAGRTRGQENANRERIWFSPHCLNPQGNLF